MKTISGVPRILANTLPEHMLTGDEEEWLRYKEYLKSARINVNVRQVFPKGFKPEVQAHSSGE
jgi:alkylated DNA repair protein alkB homolog 1